MASPIIRVLLIDDEPDGAIGQAFESVMRVASLGPGDVTASQIEEADVILIDYELGNWANPELPPACRPQNGIALASVVRSHIPAEGSAPKAIALLSGRLESLARHEPNAREHRIATAFNLEWVFRKAADDGLEKLIADVLAIATATKGLPRDWPKDGSAAEATLKKFLKFPMKAAWADPAWSSVGECYPPLHESSRWTDGLALLRWFLHRILPYPSFLLGIEAVAQRLQVHPGALREAHLANEAFLSPLSQARYKGALCDLLGPRWWAAGVEAVLWKRGGSKSPAASVMHKALRLSRLGKDSLVDGEYSVLALDETLAPSDRLLPMNACVRVQPEGWPAFAQDAWTSIESARASAQLGTLVAPRDRPRVKHE
jgi:hypothetical protein